MLDPAAESASAELLERAGISAEANECVEPSVNVRRNVDKLLAEGLVGDAVRVIAQALPKNYAIAWACSCLRRTLNTHATSDESERVALEKAERWLADPSEDNRQAAMEFAERGRYATAGCWIAAAVGWSGGSLAPKGYSVISPPDGITGHAVHGSLQLAAASHGPEMAAWLKEFASEALSAFGTRSGERQTEPT